MCRVYPKAADWLKQSRLFVALVLGYSALAGFLKEFQKPKAFEILLKSGLEQ